MAADYYSVLEVKQNATAEEIKKAYFRQVRKHPPEKEPELFMTIRAAYDTLSDPKARKNYDDMQKHGGEVQELMAEVDQFMKDGKWDQASKKLKKVVVLAPSTEAAWNLLGICFLRLQQYDRAEQTFTDLVKRSPDVALYRSNLGHVFLEQGDRAKEDRDRSDWGRRAREHFRKAVELEPFNPDTYISIARTYQLQRDYENALAWCERGVTATPNAPPDFEVLFYMCEIYLIQGQTDMIDKTAKRIMASLPAGNDDARKYAAMRFAQFALELYKAKIYVLAEPLFKAALKFDPHNEDIRVLAEYTTSTIAADKEFTALKEDYQIVEPIRGLVIYYLADVYGEKIDNKQQIFDNIITKITQAYQPDIASSVRRLRKVYPNSYKLNPEAFDKILEIAENPAYQGYGGYGGEEPYCFIVTATFGTPQSREVQRFRDFRDQYLLNNPLGRWFVATYYRFAPYLADFIRTRPWLKRLCATLLGFLAKFLP